MHKALGIKRILPQYWGEISPRIKGHFGPAYEKLDPKGLNCFQVTVAQSKAQNYCLKNYMNI